MVQSIFLKPLLPLKTEISSTLSLMVQSIKVCHSNIIMDILEQYSMSTNDQSESQLTNKSDKELSQKESMLELNTQNYQPQDHNSQIVLDQMTSQKLNQIKKVLEFQQKELLLNQQELSTLPSQTLNSLTLNTFQKLFDQQNYLNLNHLYLSYHYHFFINQNKPLIYIINYNYHNKSQIIINIIQSYTQMSRRKNKKKLQQQQDQQFQNEKTSKWATIINQKTQEQQDNITTLYTKQNKQIFNFDFSKQHLLHKQKDIIKKQQPKVILTPQQQQQLNKRLAKYRQQKQQKQKIKRQKNHQRKKIKQKQKEEQKIKKQQQDKQDQVLDGIVKSNKNNNDTSKIFKGILIIFIILAVINYQKQIYVKLSRFKLSDQVNYYQELQASNGATDQQLKTQYKKLVLRYHPDKNPNCHTCKDKFKKIMDAWQVLGNPQKKKHYDQNSGYIQQILSQSMTLTRNTYNYMLDDSDDIWIIQAYDSTNQYCHYFAQFWEQSIQNYKNIVKFGRIDVWTQSQMKSYLPYNFQVYPGLYIMHHGKDVLCQLDYDRPAKSIDFCIQKNVKRLMMPIINDQSQIKDNDRIQVILGGSIGIDTKIKLINAKYQRFIDFYSIKNKDHFVRVKGKQHKFDYNSQKSRILYQKYDKFLKGLIIQQKHMCQVYHYCKDSPCLLLLQTPQSYQGVYPYPVYKIKQDQKFKHKIQVIKNSTGLLQRFQLGLYQDGKIQLGNFDQISDLNPQSGQVIQLQCIQNSIVNKLIQLYKKIESNLK